MDITQAILWARAAESGEYLVRWSDDDLDSDSDSGSRGGFGDDELAAIKSVLSKRDLRLTADDEGLKAEGQV